jgi:hypothetical protein
VSVDAERTLTEMRTIWDETRARLVVEQARQKKYADRHRRDVKYEVGESVWLSTEHLPMKRGKLQDRYIGPFLVTKLVGEGSVELDLRGELGKTHAVFNVSRVKRYQESVNEWPGRTQPNRPAAELVDGEPEWVVEAIVGKKTRWVKRQVTELKEAPVSRRSGIRQQPPKEVTTTKRVPLVEYEVKWAGWDSSYNSWRLDEELEHCRELIDEYELQRKQTVEKLVAGDDEKALSAVVELGVATVLQWSLQDSRTTTRRGQPTVRCSYLSVASTAVPLPCVGVASCGTAVVSAVPSSGSTVASCASSAAKACDPCELGWYVGRHRCKWLAWTDAARSLSCPARASNRLSQIGYSQPPKPSGS